MTSEDAALIFEGESEYSCKFDHPMARLTGRLLEDDAKRLLRHEIGFTHIEQLEKDSFGTVFKLCGQIANRTSTSVREMACKVFNFGADWSSDQNFDEFGPRLERLNDEGVVMRKKISHKHIRRYFGSFEIYCTLNSTMEDFNLVKRISSGERIDDFKELPLIQAGLVMELIDGTLGDWKRKHQDHGLTEENAKKVSFQIGEALVYLHEKHHLIHNDLKRTNIGYFGDVGDEESHLPLLKLIDFGNASCFSEEIYKEAEVKCKGVKVKGLRSAKKSLATQTTTPRSEETENPFLVESFLFGTLIIRLMSSYLDVLLSAEQAREKFINSKNCRDLKFKKILIQMTNPKKGVTVRWAMKQYVKKKFLSIF